MSRTPDAVELIPAMPQRLWGLPAVLNFVLGGLGAGFYAAAALAAGLEAAPAVALAAWLGPALVGAGFVAVATEAGRPLRGARVLVRVRTSWMSRELVLGGIFAVAALAEWVAPSSTQRLTAVLAALALAAAQGFIVRRARAVPAWDVPIVPLVFVASAAVSGAGLLHVVEPVLVGVPGADVLGGTVVVLTFAFVAWLIYVTWSSEAVFARPTASLRDGAGVLLGIAGYLVPASILMLVVALPFLAPGAVLAGVLMIAGQVWAKWLLIVTAGTLRPISLSVLALHRRVS
jgi:DMSO reductase anchor subunit